MMEEEGIVNLREVGGAAGQEASTVRGREGAKKLFETYLLKRKLPKFDTLIELEDQICNQSILKQFGSFLIDDAETVKKGGVAVLFKGGSALQYLSHIATIISLRWPENENYKDMFQYLQKNKFRWHPWSWHCVQKTTKELRSELRSEEIAFNPKKRNCVQKTTNNRHQKGRKKHQ